MKNIILVILIVSNYFLGKQLKELEEENKKIKRMLRKLDIEIFYKIFNNADIKFFKNRDNENRD